VHLHEEGTMEPEPKWVIVGQERLNGAKEVGVRNDALVSSGMIILVHKVIKIS
jgi:hypothetical protein